MRVVAFVLLAIASTYASSPSLGETRGVKESEEKCVPGKSFKRYCNTCFCGDDGIAGHSACTLMMCDPNVWNRDGTRKDSSAIFENPISRETREVKKTARRCNPDESFNFYCNTCFCMNDGIADHIVCTEMHCNRDEWNEDGSRKIPDEATTESLLREKRDTEDRCEPGKSFKNYCNTCTCGDDGEVENSVCTRKYCSPNVWNKDGSRKIPNGVATESLLREQRDTEDLCEPGKSFKDYCNTCTCGDDGKVENSVCTRKYCSPNVWNKDGSRKIPDGVATESLLREQRDTEELCEPGKPFMDYCNTCFCGDDGKVESSVCTKMFCSRNSWNKDDSRDSLLRVRRETGERCNPGKSFKYYCNTCYCGNDGKVDNSACTLMYCNPEDWNKDGSRKNPDGAANSSLLRVRRQTGERCIPGKSFKYYCNTCHCGNDGTVDNSACTMMYCNPEVWNKDGSTKNPNGAADSSLLRVRRETGERCNPGKSFKYYCNTCYCGSEGTVDNSACTMMYCNSAVWNKDGSRKNPNAVRHGPGDRCDPGKSFKNYCNTCHCGYDGTVRNSACTMMYCTPGVWNKDGSRKNPNEVAGTNSFLRKQRSTDFLCQPGKSFKDDCNTCYCERDGRNSACTMMHCRPRDASLIPALQVCEPGKRFNIDCDQCVCSEDGLRVACTKMACSQQNEQRNKRSPRVAKLSMVCEPERTYKKDCNTCVCNKSGTAARCTLKACL